MKKLNSIVAAIVIMLGIMPNQFIAAATDGALAGRFAINTSGDQVVFSQGNLQYRATTGTWQFASRQYDFVGYDNENIASGYDGWIDLFGWGTGDNPVLATNVSSDYSSFTDWGANVISNGGNQAGLWRTLTKDEWVYLFQGRTNADQLFALGSVNGINGVILLPDDWTFPAGTGLNPSIDYGLTWNGQYYNEGNGLFAINAYSDEEWKVMEQEGAVFLPASGYRLMTCVSNVGAQGNYWSATGGLEEYAYGLNIASYALNPQRDVTCETAFAVRLVKEFVDEEQTDWWLKGDFNNWEGDNFKQLQAGDETIYAKVKLSAGKE